MLEAFGFVDHTVQVVVPRFSLPRHGTATFGGYKIPFVVDRPKKLTRPHKSTILSIFEQFKKLEMPAEIIEVAVGSKRRAYRLVDGRPELIRSVSA